MDGTKPTRGSKIGRFLKSRVGFPIDGLGSGRHNARRRAWRGRLARGWLALSIRIKWSSAMSLFVRARVAALWGLGFAGAIALVVPSDAKQTDPNVRKTANTANPGSSAVRPAVPPLAAGTLDFDRLLDKETGYIRIRDEAAAFGAEYETRKAEAARDAAEIQAGTTQLSRLQRGTPDFDKQATRLAELKAKFDAKDQLSRQDLAFKDAKLMAAIYSDIQRVASVVAKSKGLNMVVQASSNPLGTLKDNPMTVEIALNRPVVFSDPQIDITGDVLDYLNKWYAQNRTAAPSAPAPTSAAPPAPAPPAPQPPRPSPR